MILDNQNVLTVVAGTIVQVFNPATGAFTECLVEQAPRDSFLFDPNEIYLTTTDSTTDQDVIDALTEGDYDQHIRHLRSEVGGSAVMTRTEIASRLDSGTYVIG